MTKQTNKTRRTRHKLPKRGAGKRIRQTKTGAGLLYYGETSIIDTCWQNAVTAVDGLANMKTVLNLR